MNSVKGRDVPPIEQNLNHFYIRWHDAVTKFCIQMLFKESGVINLLTLHAYTCRRSSALAFFFNTTQDPVHQLSGQNSWFVNGRSGFKFGPGDQTA